MYGFNGAYNYFGLVRQASTFVCRVSAFGTCCVILIEAIPLLSAFSIPGFKGGGKPCQRHVKPPHFGEASSQPRALSVGLGIRTETIGALASRLYACCSLRKPLGIDCLLLRDGVGANFG